MPKHVVLRKDMLRRHEWVIQLHRKITLDPPHAWHEFPTFSLGFLAIDGVPEELMRLHWRWPTSSPSRNIPDPARPGHQIPVHIWLFRMAFAMNPFRLTNVCGEANCVNPFHHIDRTGRAIEIQRPRRIRRRGKSIAEVLQQSVTGFRADAFATRPAPVPLAETVPEMDDDEALADFLEDWIMNKQIHSMGELIERARDVYSEDEVRRAFTRLSDPVKAKVAT